MHFCLALTFSTHTLFYRIQHIIGIHTWSHKNISTSGFADDHDSVGTVVEKTNNLKNSFLEAPASTSANMKGIFFSSDHDLPLTHCSHLRHWTCVTLNASLILTLILWQYDMPHLYFILTQTHWFALLLFRNAAGAIDQYTAPHSKAGEVKHYGLVLKLYSFSMQTL